jgi:hypothetical protein
MTEFLSQNRLHQLASVTEYPSLQLGRPVLRLIWTIDAQTGCPIGRWGYGEDAGGEEARPLALAQV